MKLSAAKCFGALCIVLGFSSGPALADTPTMSQYMNCARGIGVAINDRFAILPGERAGDQGLYVYTDRGAFFLRLGAPDIVDGDAQEFNLRTSVSNVGDLLLSFRAKRPGSKANIEPGISYQAVTPATVVRGSYRLTPAYDTLDDRARDLLRERLRERVASIKEFIDDKNRYSAPADARIAFERDRATYLSKLERCRIEGDRKLASAVAEEMQKLASGFPGVTIWEKEISGRMSASR